MNVNLLPVPGVPTVTHFTITGFMGVLYPTCIIVIATATSPITSGERGPAPRSRSGLPCCILLETFALEEVTAAIEDALHLGTISFDSVRHLLVCRIERRPPRLDLENWPYLRPPKVQTTQAADYMALLGEVRFHGSTSDTVTWAGSGIPLSVVILKPMHFAGY
jgi:hypothetical protein